MSNSSSSLIDWTLLGAMTAYQSGPRGASPALLEICD